MKTTIYHCTIISIFAALVALAPAPIHAAGLRYDVQTWNVDPSTTGALVEDHRTPLILIRIEFPVGIWSQWAHENHAQDVWLIQALGAMRGRADNLAADVSSFMNQWTSGLSVTCRKDDIKDILTLAREILANKDFDISELDKRDRGMQWLMSMKNPNFVTAQAVHRLMFSNEDPRRRPYEKPDKPLIDRRKLAATRDAIARLPGRVIGFAGDLTRTEAESWARDLLPPASDQMPSGISPQLLPLSRRESRPSDQTFTMPRLTQVFFAYVRESLAFADPDKPAQMIADHVLGGHIYSRLSEALRHEEGETYGTGVNESGNDFVSGVYGAWTFTKTANAVFADDKLRTVIKEFFEHGITEQERASAAGYLLGRRAFDRQAPGQVLDEFLWEHWQGVPRGYRDQLAERAATVSLADVNAFIRRFYDPAQFTMIKVAPGE
jgi:predicted Zn-dependent peptidase